MKRISAIPWQCLKDWFFPAACTLLLMGCLPFLYREPLPYASLRATPLHFGLHVTPNPESNPINPPERFSGYHMGADFEVTQQEVDSEVAVFAICSGPVLQSGFVEGYGGLVVQRCAIGREPVTVLYGHLTLENLPIKDAELSAGGRIGVLAPARTHDSDDNRKHLHLGIHRGEGIDVRGYVQSEEEIDEFIDPLTVLPPRGGTTGVLKPYWQE